MNEIDRVARAICSKRVGHQCYLGDGRYGGEPGGRCGCGYTDDMRGYAQAAIDELKDGVDNQK